MLLRLELKPNQSKRFIKSSLQKRGFICLPSTTRPLSLYERSALGRRNKRPKPDLSNLPRFIRYSELKPIRVERFEGLEVEAILKWARSVFLVDEYLPSYEYKRAPNREWLCNVSKSRAINVSVHSVEPGKFKAYIKGKLEAREQSVIVKQFHTIDCIPEVTDAFAKTSHISSKLHFLNFLQHREVGQTCCFARARREARETCTGKR